MQQNIVKSTKIMENLSIRELRNKLPRKCKYAMRVVEKLTAADIDITEDAVYEHCRANKGTHERAIKKALISIIREEDAKYEAIV